MNNNKSPSLLRLHGGLLKSVSLLAMGAALGLTPAAPSQAQVRVYDAATGQSVAPASTPATSGGISIGSTPASGGSIGGIRTGAPTTTPVRPQNTTGSTAGATKSPVTTLQTPQNQGGIRIGTTPAQPAKSGAQATTVNQGVNTTAAPLKPGVTTTVKTVSTTTLATPQKAPYVPDRVQLDALGKPILTKPAQNAVTSTNIGEVFVFVNVSEFSPIMAQRLDQIKKVPGITPVFYMDERRPQDYMNMLGESFFKIADKITFSVDASGQYAEAYGVTSANTIVYRLPGGVIRRYNLVSEIAVFLDQVERLRQGSAT